MRSAVRGGGALLAAVSLLFAGGSARAAAPGADLAYHGSATLRGGLVDVRFTPRNHGSAAVPDAAVRLRWSAPLAARQPALPPGCARIGALEVVCRTGPIAADGVGERIALAVRLRERPGETVLEVGTLWNGGAADRDRPDSRPDGRQRVLVLDTGDSYYF
ncbi:hypothetical protein ACL02U_12430 [Streptomyces sp. MS06]|uniref:hypothetical protein n=1 Tax=Streptomyces sp. MS06 TaxID=3385974 RepID=UPI00399FCD5A